jgi:hypothetical protein
MNKLTKFLVEGVLKEAEAGIIVMLPGGFKPPHGGHLELAKRYAALPNVAEVRILIGPKERDGITMKQSMDVWKILLGGTTNIKVEQAPNDNPMRAAYEFVEKAPAGTYALGASSKGSDYARVKGFVDGHALGAKYHRPGVNVVELSLNTSPILYKGRTDELNGQGLSASTLRADLAAKNFDNFKTNYPGIPESTVKSVFKILAPGQPLQEVDLSAIVKKISSRFQAFLRSIAAESRETKEAFVMLAQAAQGKKTLTDAEKEEIGNQMKDVLKTAGIIAASVLPGGTIYFILIRLLRLEKYTIPQNFLNKVATTAPLLEEETLNENAAVMAAMAASTAALLSSQGKYNNGGDWSFNPIGWFKDFLQDRKLQKIADRLVQDPEIQKLVRDHTFLDKNKKVIATQNIKGIQSILKNKLKPEEMQYLKYGWGPRLRKAMSLTEGRQLLKEGGAAGHMTHPYEDYDLTFKDANNMIDAALSGKVEYAQEKLDGQNLMATYKDGQVRAARNKGHLKDAGATSLTVKQVEDMFAGRGAIQSAFGEAMKDLEAAINKLTPEQKAEFFDNGKKFVNFEVLYPPTSNVIPYGATQLRLHNITEYDPAGNVVNTDTDAVHKLDGALQQVQAQNQKTYEIRVTDPITINKSADYEKQRDELHQSLRKLREQYKLKEDDKVSVYIQAWWTNYIKNTAKQYSYDVPANTLQQLINRWAYSNKEVNIKVIRDGITNEDFKNWVVNFDKKDYVTQKKICIKPLETVFLKLGVYTLKNVSQLVSLNPNDTVRQINKDLDDAIAKIKAAAQTPEMSDDDTSLLFLKRELTRLKDIGGFKAIVPLEGIVFKYNGKLYKLTGAFAPINQILGYLKF